MFTKPFEKIDELNKNIAARQKAMESILNSKLDSDFYAVGEKIDFIEADLQAKFNNIKKIFSVNKNEKEEGDKLF